MTRTLGLRGSLLAVLWSVGCAVPEFKPRAPAAADAADVTPATDLGADAAPDVATPMDTGVDAGPMCAAGATVCGDGGCADLTTDARNCGRCGHDCTALPNVVGDAARCMGGVCVLTGACQPGFLHCAGTADVGCETSSRASPNCGGCGVTCPADRPFCDVAAPSPGADGGVDAGAAPGYACTDRCGAGMAICAGTACANLRTDVANCGRCGMSCPGRANASPACTAGACAIVCLGGYGDCDGDPSNGCETNTNTTAANCGTCGHACATRPNATPVCALGGCVYVCIPGFADCDGVASNGCEVNLATDTANCGTCAHTCPTGAHATATCAGMVCGIACSTGYTDCNHDATDGCEAQLATDINNCGTCSRMCHTGPHATVACTAGACGITCTAVNFADCDSFPDNGCEVDTNTNLSNCGGCGNACPSRPNADPTCSGGTCGVSCHGGSADCNGDPTDGCETPLDTSSNCRSCGDRCPSPGFCALMMCIH